MILRYVQNDKQQAYTIEQSYNSYRDNTMNNFRYLLLQTEINKHFKEGN
jgi:hypothetical protein